MQMRALPMCPAWQNLLGEQYEAKKKRCLWKNKWENRCRKPSCGILLRIRQFPSGTLFRFAEALGRAGIPLEYHLYPTGEHGLSLAVDSIRRKDGSGSEKGCESWFPLLKSWLLRKFGL